MLRSKPSGPATSKLTRRTHAERLLVCCASVKGSPVGNADTSAAGQIGTFVTAGRRLMPPREVHRQDPNQKSS